MGLDYVADRVLTFSGFPTAQQNLFSFLYPKLEKKIIFMKGYIVLQERF
jgi:hypothetical protein